MAKFVMNKGIKNNTSYYWFVMKSANGQPVVTSETYTSKQACKDGIKFVKDNAASATTEDATGEK